MSTSTAPHPVFEQDRAKTHSGSPLRKRWIVTAAFGAWRVGGWPPGIEVDPVRAAVEVVLLRADLEAVGQEELLEAAQPARHVVHLDGRLQDLRPVRGR